MLMENFLKEILWEKETETETLSLNVLWVDVITSV